MSAPSAAPREGLCPRRTLRRTFGYDSPLMIAVMWQFDVKKGREQEFESLYGADGDWTALNRQTRSVPGQLVSQRPESPDALSADRVLERDDRLRAAPRVPVRGD